VVPLAEERADVDLVNRAHGREQVQLRQRSGIIWVCACVRVILVIELARRARRGRAGRNLVSSCRMLRLELEGGFEDEYKPL
jgi:hypothetical protein